MNQEIRSLTARQAKAVDLLMSGATKTQTAQAVGVTQRTMSKWVALPEFREAMQTATGPTMQNATTKLVGAMGKAIDTIIEIIDSPDSSPTIRLRASMAIIENGLKLVEVTEVLKRLEALEVVVNRPRGNF